MTRITHLLAALYCCCLLGCGPTEDPQATANAQAALDAGFEAYDGGNWEEAVNQLTLAIDIGGINPDHFGDALIKRSICLARTGKYAEAHADLDKAEQGADLAMVYAARSFAYEQEGKKKEASDAMREAKKYNRAIKKIKA